MEWRPWAPRDFEWRRAETGLLWGWMELGAQPGQAASWRQDQDRDGSTLGQGRWVLTFSPVSVTTSKGPYMKRPFSTWGRPSHTTVSFARWLEVTFWREETV